MKELHLARIGKLLFLTQVITTVFLTVGLMSQLMLSGMPPALSIIPIVLNMLVFAGALIMRLKFNGTSQAFAYGAFSFVGLYAVIMFTAQSGNVFPYIIPYLIVLVLALNSRLVYIVGGSFIGINVVRVILTMSQAAQPDVAIESCMIEMIITILVAVVCMHGVTQINRYFVESSEEIRSASEKNMDISNKIVEVARAVEEETERAGESILQILAQTQNVSSAMKDVSTGIAEVVEAISNQTIETQSIQNVIHDTSNRTEQIGEITNAAQDVIVHGGEAMSKLMEKVEVSIQEGAAMKEAAALLKEKTNEVRGITDIILSISSQTNLLALNASIEAARAGDAGRGFAVVADEIRNLAEQTRVETENITRLLDGLITDADSVTSKVNGNVEISNAENALALEANNQFIAMKTQIDGLADSMNEVNDMMNHLVQFNNAIVDSVNTLSAGSEEITASATEAYEMSEQNVTIVNEFKNVMDDITKHILELEKYNR